MLTFTGAVGSTLRMRRDCCSSNRSREQQQSVVVAQTVSLLYGAVGFQSDVFSLGRSSLRITVFIFNRFAHAAGPGIFDCWMDWWIDRLADWLIGRVIDELIG